MTLVLGWALLASTAAPFVFTGAPGNFIGIMAGAYLIQSWHDAAPPAKEDWWRRGRTWVHALGIAVAVTVAFLLT